MSHFTTTTPEATPREKTPRARVTMPTTIVIFGITGDLASRKLLPALWHLFIRGRLPETFSIIGFSRPVLSDEEMRARAEDILKERMADASADVRADFLRRISYVPGDFGDAKSYRALFEAVSAADARIGQCSAKLMHLAVPPSLYGDIFERLHASGLADMCGGLGGWTRVLVEKPFGSDWHSANELDKKLAGLFREEQIFRVDHYMDKEAMQNILAFRFSNALLERLWSRAFIERVHVRIFEELGMEGRGAFYDAVGALRDVGENHVLQMLAFVAMEDPNALEAHAIRSARAAVLESLAPPTRAEMSARAARAQYRGFQSEPSVKPDSATETYFRVEARVENDRWRGVPFILEGGKKLGESKAEIEIVFRKQDSCLCAPGEEMHPQNTLLFRIQPQEGIAITFFAKHPGFEMTLEPKVLSFRYADNEDMQDAPDAYERVIFDCIAGDPTLFASTREVLASWKFITPVIEAWDAVPLKMYEPGWVPKD